MARAEAGGAAGAGGRAAVVIGAGVAGLCAARRLHARGVRVTLLEASDGVGGRVRSDTLEGGWTLDRGFHIFLTAYPEAQRTLDYDRLKVREALVQSAHTTAQPQGGEMRTRGGQGRAGSAAARGGCARCAVGRRGPLRQCCRAHCQACGAADGGARAATRLDDQRADVFSAAGEGRALCPEERSGVQRGERG